MHLLAHRTGASLTFIFSQAETLCQSKLNKVEETFTFQLVPKFSHMINKTTNCSELKITVVNGTAMSVGWLRRLMPCPMITSGYTAMQGAKNTMVTSWLHSSQGFG